MMIRFVVVLVIAHCAFIEIAGLQAADPVQLRYRFEPGQIVRYRVAMRDDYSIQVGGDAEQPYTEQNSVKQYRVKEVRDDGSAVLELMLESARIEILNNGEKQLFDSTTTDTPPSFLPLRGLLGQPHLQVTASPQGKLSEISSLQKDLKATGELSQSALDAFIMFPAEPVTVGTGWKEEFEVSVRVSEKLSRSVKMLRQFTLTNVEGALATIRFDTRVLTPINDPDQQLQLIRRPSSGEITFDLQRGLLVSKTISLNQTVVNFGGAASLMSLKLKHSETLLDVQLAQPAATDRR